MFHNNNDNDKTDSISGNVLNVSFHFGKQKRIKFIFKNLHILIIKY